MDEHIIARFWSRVERRAPDDCWPWTALAKRGAGYGQMNIGRHGVTMTSHRIAWTIVNGDIPVGMVIRHTCDNRLCCNPAHLLLGTQKENVADAVNRGRWPSGTASVNAKLTDTQVAAIRADPRGARKVAADYGVCATTIKNVRSGVRY